MRLFISVNTSNVMLQPTKTQPLEWTSNKKEAEAFAKQYKVKVSKYTLGSSPNSNDEVIFLGATNNILMLLGEYSSGNASDVAELIELYL